MLRIITDQPDRVGQWMEGHGNDHYNPRTMTARGLERNGTLVVGVSFRKYRGPSVALHVAVADKSALSRGFLKHCFDYSFNVLKADTVIFFIDSGNHGARRMAEGTGGKFLAAIPGVGSNGDDFLIYTMTRNECRFLT